MYLKNGKKNMEYEIILSDTCLEEIIWMEVCCSLY